MRKFWILGVAPALCAPLLLTSCSSVHQSGTTPAGATEPEFLYVGSSTEPPYPQAIVTGYSISPDGSLTAAPCAPIQSGSVGLAGAGNLLFTSDGLSISTWSLDQRGCPTLKGSTEVAFDPDPQCYSPCPFDGPGALFLDPKDQNLYSWNVASNNGSVFVSYNVDSASGGVSWTSQADAGYPQQPAAALVFSSDATHAVSTTYEYDAVPGSSGILVYNRLSDGTLKYLNSAPGPALDPGFAFAPSWAAGDSANHFLIAGQVTDSWPEGPWQFAIYTMDSSGNLTTQSTQENMTAPPGVGPDELVPGYAFSPDGRFLAFAGSINIDLYTWDSATATLTFIATIAQQRGCDPSGPCPYIHNLTWDRYDHLLVTWGTYEDPGMQLEVYTVSVSGAVQAPGSPYPAPLANALAVVDGR